MAKQLNEGLGLLDANGEVQGWHHAPRPLPELYLEAATNLAAAVEQIEAWNVPVPHDSRLRIAVTTLRAAAERHPSDLVELGEFSAALLVAVHFKGIAMSLPAHRVRSLRDGLTEAIGGVLVPRRGARRALQRESELLVGGALHLAGAEYAYSTPRANQPEAPDFTLCVRDTECGIEVKRPESEKRILASFEKALNQLNARNVLGVVVLDLTDVLVDAHVNDAGAAMRRLRDDFGNFVLERKRLAVDGYDRLGAVYLWARFPRIRVVDGVSTLAVEHWGGVATFADETVTVAEALRDALTLGLLRTFEGY